MKNPINIYIYIYIYMNEIIFLWWQYEINSKYREKTSMA